MCGLLLGRYVMPLRKLLFRCEIVVTQLGLLSGDPVSTILPLNW